MMKQGPRSWLRLLISLCVTLTRILIQKSLFGTSLVVQWLRIHLPVQGTWVRSLVQEDLPCRGWVTKPVGHNP